MKTSTQRSLRTLLQGLLSAITLVPLIALVVLPSLPKDSRAYALVVAVVGGTATVSKVINVLEEKGVLKALLKTDAAPAPVAPAAPAPVAPAAP